MRLLRIEPGHYFVTVRGLRIGEIVRAKDEKTWAFRNTRKETSGEAPTRRDVVHKIMSAMSGTKEVKL